jgi:hypothetical protein
MWKVGRTANDLLERLDTARLLEHVVETRDLDQPANIVGEELILDDPLRELVPLSGGPTNRPSVSG